MVGLFVRLGKSGRVLLYAEQKGAGKMAEFSSAGGKEKYRRVVRYTDWGRKWLFIWRRTALQRSEEASLICRTTSWLQQLQCC